MNLACMEPKDLTYFNTSSYKNFSVSLQCINQCKRMMVTLYDIITFINYNLCRNFDILFTNNFHSFDFISIITLLIDQTSGYQIQLVQVPPILDTRGMNNVYK